MIFGKIFAKLSCTAVRVEDRCAAAVGGAAWALWIVNGSRRL
jgi:hypothetical protein